MKKFFVFSALLAAFFVAGTGTQNGEFALNITAAFASDNDSKSRASSESDDGDSASQAKSDSKSQDKESKDSNSKDSSSNEDSVKVCHSAEHKTLIMAQSEYEIYYQHQFGYKLGACGDDDSASNEAASCECPPGVACTCADGTAGSESGAPTAAGPTQFRSF